MASAAYSKALGRKGQQKVREKLLEAFPELGDRDITSRPMGSPGEDLILSEAAYRSLPFDIEVKYGKSFNIVEACKQARAESRGDGTPLGVGCYRHKKPEEWFVCLTLDDFLSLLKNIT